MAVTGIGGLFFRAQDPAALCDWYRAHLGVDVGGIWSQQAGMSLIVPFKADTDYFPADKAFMLNFRVDALDPLLASLRAAGIDVITRDEWDSPETGRFARIHDPEGNAVELWQPPSDETSAS